MFDPTSMTVTVSDWAPSKEVPAITISSPGSQSIKDIKIFKNVHGCPKTGHNKFFYSVTGVLSKLILVCPAIAGSTRKPLGVVAQPFKSIIP